MKNSKHINRREFIKKLGKHSSGIIIGGYILDSVLFQPQNAMASIVSNIYVAKNGTPAQNVAKVFEMKYGGIEDFIDIDDVVVINPNGQWTNQGGSNCACCMGLIDLILNRPGGFNGEIIFTECTQFQNRGYWTATNSELDRNGPYNFNDMILYYQNQGHTNVNGVRIRRNADKPDEWPILSGPSESQGWIRPEWISPTSDCLFYLPYPVIHSPYSNRLINLKDGIYENDQLTSTNLKFIKIPNLNNHGTNALQDYAGVTSAIKSFLGIAELENHNSGPFNDGHKNMHTYSDICHGSSASQKAFAAGEAVGGWMTLCRKPDIILTTAEWVGWGSRSGSDATQAKTVGLCDNPTSSDYFMCKYVLWPTHTEQQYFNPDYDINNNMTRQTINGCISQGFGTANESEIAAFIYDFNSPNVTRQEIDQMIKLFREGQASEQDVLNLIDLYNNGGK